MLRRPQTSTSASSLLASAEAALQDLRGRGDGSAFSALCRDLAVNQAPLYAALCLPALEEVERSAWLNEEGLALRPSFRWGGLSVRIRSPSAFGPLLRSAHPENIDLRSLRVEGVEASCVSDLLQKGYGAGLCEIAIEGCGLSGRGSAYPLDEHVLQLDMEGNERLFDALRSLEGLRVLRLAENRLGNRGLTLLRGFEQLEGLELRGNAISDRGLEVLSRFDALKRLGLRNNRIQGSGLAFLAHSVSLRALDLSQNPLTDSTALESLVKRLPRCEIRADHSPLGKA